VKEFYPGNSYYGIGNIVRKYAGFPDYLPLPVSLQHGWSILPTNHDAHYNAGENWYWSRDLEEKYIQQYPGLKTRTIGAPFLYLLRLLNYVEPKNKQGSIVFPSHSSSLIKIQCDFYEYALMLASLPEEYKPITVCLYFLDLDKGLDKPFREQGFEIVSNGENLYAVNFLENFVNNVHGKKYAFSNQMTSALLFAVSMGLLSFFLGPEFITKSDDPNYINIDYTLLHRDWEASYLAYFRFPLSHLQQKDLVRKELGIDYILSEKKMLFFLWKSVFTKTYMSTFLKSGIKLALRDHLKILRY
jgi:hypothetical protein